ncbi:Lrp/AsnC family transcriptional regulator [Vibrio genomosp. F10]|uniref:AsnC family transcriptional regulator n=2 Tax=Vibrio genomosp. F10 TaxID=723171 RepID=A0A1B9QYS0_9VIBR|nr:Lrp/AsnC family transcriptional regulator [Vibrio genomosp. F10]OCH75503.1 AsnC family transcriptional regulator [Vibrio genomosp. F10]OEE31364.1 AsnC family transcriptional regulator [Vibrio genomosp. F10 str. ZF-129]OEE96466.1 AsnC family transcriptional regulator [Vibrio genomosp. F10 str. 9ZC157]OEE97084.1 AsnC family transcriptional regulator [Vibrio genomosp. F10 str. 9ZD137]
MDRIDRRILELIQQQGRLSTADLADKVGLSASPCARRLKKLEDEGVIDSYNASLNKGKLGIGMTVFVEVSLNNHQAGSIDGFEQAMCESKEVINCHVVSGAYDYLLEVVTKDLEGYEQFTRQLQRIQTVKDIHTHLAIRQVKQGKSLPILI